MAGLFDALSNLLESILSIFSGIINGIFAIFQSIFAVFETILSQVMNLDNIVIITFISVAFIGYRVYLQRTVGSGRGLKKTS